MKMTLLSFVTMSVLSPCYRLIKRPSLRVIKMVVTSASTISERMTLEQAFEKKMPRPQEEDSRWKRWLFLNEDNLRFLLLTFITIIYMVSGAAIFQALESDNELATLDAFHDHYSQGHKQMQRKLQMGNLTITEINEIIYLWGNATYDGILRPRRMWDYAGSFYFVYTIVATVGFGYSSPRTTSGRIFCIFFGLLGCSFGILFFNLFLERVITLLSYIMKANYRRKLHRRASKNSRSNSWTSFEDLDSWRPSVYWVIFYLLLASCIIALLASVMYMKVEKWSYLNSFYFCFVAFSTIGFGDYVSAQEANEYYGQEVRAYQFGNFMVMVFGTCCLYSFFNVLSITVKHSLNWTIRHFEYYVDRCCGCSLFEDTSQLLTAPFHHQKNRISSSVYCSEAERKLSTDVFTTHNNAAANKVRDRSEAQLEIIEKQLIAIENVYNGHFVNSSAGSQRTSKSHMIPGQVGGDPLSIISSKLRHDEEL